MAFREDCRKDKRRILDKATDEVTLEADISCPDYIFHNACCIVQDSARWQRQKDRIKRQQAGAGMPAPVPPAKYEKTNYRSFISSTKMKASKPLFSGILYSGDKVTLTYLAFTGENLSAWALMPLPYWSSVISG